MRKRFNFYTRRVNIGRKIVLSNRCKFNMISTKIVFRARNEMDDEDKEREIVNNFCIGHDRLPTNQELEELDKR